jgi:hypothetical protein
MIVISRRTVKSDIFVAHATQNRTILKPKDLEAAGASVLDIRFKRTDSAAQSSWCLVLVGLGTVECP